MMIYRTQIAVVFGFFFKIQICYPTKSTEPQIWIALTIGKEKGWELTQRK